MVRYCREKDILINMEQISFDIVLYLDNLQKEYEKLKDELNNIDNDFFIKNKKLVESFSHYNDYLQHPKNNLKEFISELRSIEDTCCYHEFIEDYIDTDVEKSCKIIYCKFCHISKNI